MQKIIPQDFREELIPLPGFGGGLNGIRTAPDLGLIRASDISSKGKHLSSFLNDESIDDCIYCMMRAKRCGYHDIVRYTSRTAGWLHYDLVMDWASYNTLPVDMIEPLAKAIDNFYAKHIKLVQSIKAGQKIKKVDTTKTTKLWSAAKLQQEVQTLIKRVDDLTADKKILTISATGPVLNKQAAEAQQKKAEEFFETKKFVSDRLSDDFQEPTILNEIPGLVNS